MFKSNAISWRTSQLKIYKYVLKTATFEVDRIKL